MLSRRLSTICLYVVYGCEINHALIILLGLFIVAQHRGRVQLGIRD